MTGRCDPSPQPGVSRQPHRHLEESLCRSLAGQIRLIRRRPADRDLPLVASPYTQNLFNRSPSCKMYRLLITSVLLYSTTCSASSAPTEVGSACGAELGDCAGTLHCVPSSANCTDFQQCHGSCEDLSSSPQQIYTLCGGWDMIDDCDERVEYCIADPRRERDCGPSCDGPGICSVFSEICGGDYDTQCPDGKACFGGDKTEWEEYWPPRLCEYDDSYPGGQNCAGYCFPLRFGSDHYPKSREWEIVRTDQDGYPWDDGNNGERRS